MSIILSVYNNFAFCEFVLPQVTNSEHSFLLDANLFHLEKNYVIEMECIENRWYFLCEEGCGYKVTNSLHHISQEVVQVESGRYDLETAHKDVLSVLVDQKENPLNVYEKIILKPGVYITVGSDPNNSIQYFYSSPNETKSFVSRHHCVIHYDGRVTELEDHSSNGTYVNNIRTGEKRILQFGDSIRVFGLNIVYLGAILAVNRSTGAVFHVKLADDKELQGYEQPGVSDGSSERQRFFRAPRSVPRINTENITIDPVPNPRELPTMPLFMQIGPAMTMALPMLLGSGLTIYAARASGNSNPALMMTGIITAGTSAIIGAFWAFMNVRFNKRTIKEGERKRYEKYGNYLIEKQEEVEQKYIQNTEAYREKYISSDLLADYTADNEKLWSRNFNHSDVLVYRLGLGEQPFPAQISIPNMKFTMVDDSLAEKPEMIRNRFSVMRDVPVCVDLHENSIIGVIGTANGWAEVIRNIIVQIAANNSYTDVKIALVFDANNVSNRSEWDFVKWLPHVWSDDKKIRYFATNKNEANEVFYSLGQTLHARVESGEDTARRPYFILFVLNKELLEGELIAKYIGKTSNELGISTVIAADKYELLPNICEYVIENNPQFAGYYNTVDENSDKKPVVFDRITSEKAKAFAKRLANIEIEETEGGGEVPNSITFFEMLGISKPQDLDSISRWRKSKTQDSMKAMIGYKSGMKPCYLDIHERYHGPHGLVAGTTGSGKSETLQTYMLSLAANYSPDDVGFFIIDYKGGGMANLFEGLPHMIGTISNLSGNQVKRAMVSIKSENKRRQRIFSDYGVNNINSYTSLYKNGDAKEPIPHMLIIIDEFAELKREEPEFMKELVSVAQVGRSLGVHLILATQKPAGTVDDNIWSNSKFKLCLRVQDRQDSMDVLHRADAAYLTQAGRGFLQVGSDELFELFQSGYSGALYDEYAGDGKLVVAQMLNSIGKVDLAGNHLKIQHQNEVEKRWLNVLYSSVLRAQKDHSVTLVGDDSALINKIYKNIEAQGMEYKKTSYNTARLREFVDLADAIDVEEGADATEKIRAYARENRVRLPEMKSKTQLEAITEYLHDVAVRNGFNHSISLWMPLLPELMVLEDMEGYQKDRLLAEKSWSLSAVIGLGDDPENQSQMPISVDFGNNGNYAVCGSVSTGKSTFLQTVIYSFIHKYTPEQVNFYILDFSTKLLNVFENSKHVGGFMSDTEEDAEKVSKFFTMISQIMKDRKKLLVSSNYQDYVERNRNAGLPAIVIVLDNYASFKEKTNEQYEDNVRQILKEGINYGIYLIVTSGGFGTSEIPSRFADYFRTTICLEMSNPYQYSDVMRVARVPIYPETNVKGRGLVFYGERIIEFQTAVPCHGDNTLERNDYIREEIERVDASNSCSAAKRIPVIPANPVWSEYTEQEEYGTLIKTPNLLPNGYNAVTAAYSSIDLTSLLTYAISGTRRSGKSTYMTDLIHASVDKGSHVYVIEIGSHDFERTASAAGVSYITDGQGVYDLAKNTLLPEVSKRAEKKKACMEKHMEDEEFFAEMAEYDRYCIFIPNMPGFVKELNNAESPAKDARAVYETLTGDKGFHYNFYFFAEVSDNDLSEIMGYTVMMNFRENGTGIRFGGKYLAQKLFTFANVPYKNQNVILPPGVGVIPTELENEPIQQIVVPNYKG